MRCFVILLICCLLQQSIGRPQAPQETQENYRDADEAEYDEDDEEAAMEDSSREDEEAAVDERFSVNKPDRRFKGQDDEGAENDQNRPAANDKPDGRSENNNDNNEFIHETDNQEAKGYLRSQQVNIQDRDSSQLDESNDMVYENSDDNKQEHSSKIDKNKHNKDNAERIGRFHFYNRYYNRYPAKDKDSDDNPHEKLNTDISNRDRRDANDSTDEGSNQKSKENINFDNFENEAEQAIIQKYIKKLNKKEVEELMSTLSADKKSLLAQIINNGESKLTMSLSKREITKKAGAVEENNLMDGVQSDSNSNSDPLLHLNIGDTSQNNDASGITATTNEDVSSTKADDNKVNRRSSDLDEENSERLEVKTITDTSTETTTGKSDNKREANFSNFNKDGSPEMDLNINESKESAISDLREELYANSQDEDLTQLMDDEAQLHYDYSNPHKRELNLENNADLSDPMKSLQESFSNANAYEDSGYYSGSNMAPLVRVKRRNKEHAVIKRAAAILPESKVAYVPENEDADNDEGDEFYDDGFFDRTANLAKSNSRIGDVSDLRNSVPLNVEGNESIFRRSSGLINDAPKDAVSIGSDTDNVLSGVEGADEHLMYTGGSRKKRAADRSLKLEPADDLINNDMLSSSNPPRSSLVDNVSRSENYGVSYIGDEGFGPLSKSSEAELSRYKRIRRLKQESASEGPSTTEQAVD